MGELSSRFNATPDGVMTNEVGVISGELELRSTHRDDGSLGLDVRYLGADEWYSLKGRGYQLHDQRDHPIVHQLLVNVLSRPRI